MGKLHMRSRKLKAVLIPTLLLFTSMSLWLPVASAATLGTASALPPAEATVSPVQDWLAQSSVRAHMIALGVDPDQAAARVAALTPQERQLLEQRIGELPAGAGAIEVIGIVFLVLLILELVGVTDIFKKI